MVVVDSSEKRPDISTPTSDADEALLRAAQQNPTVLASLTRGHLLRLQRIDPTVMQRAMVAARMKVAADIAVGKLRVPDRTSEGYPNTQQTANQDMEARHQAMATQPTGSLWQRAQRGARALFKGELFPDELQQKSRHMWQPSETDGPAQALGRAAHGLHNIFSKKS